MVQVRSIGVGVVGVGRMGRLFAHLATEFPGSHLVGVTDLIRATSEAVATELDSVSYADYEALLQAPQLDAVVIATPDHDHVGPAVAAAQAGKHLFVEKPLATSKEDCGTIVQAAQTAGTLLMVGHVLRFDPNLRQVKSIIENGELGELVHTYTRRSTSMADAMRQKGRTTITYYLGVHDIDLLNWIVGSPITSVFSRGCRKVMSRFNVDDTVMSLCRFENGAIGALETFWIRPNDPGAAGLSSMFEVAGTEGIIQVVPGTPILVGSTSSGSKAENRWYSTAPGATHGPYRDEFVHFIECVRTGNQPAVSGEDGLRAVVVADAIEKSLATGKEVTVQQA